MEAIKLTDKVLLVTKLAKGGDLLSYLTAQGVDKLPEMRTRELMEQICCGVEHIHA